MQTSSLWQSGSRAVVGSGEPPREADFVVVGAGLLGAMCAYWLARAGSSVVVVERHAVAWGATGRNSGLVIPTTAEAYDQAVLRLGAPTAMAIRQLAAEGAGLLGQVVEEEHLTAEYRPGVFLQLATGEEDAASCLADIEATRRHGFEAAWLDRDQLQPRIGTRLSDTIPGAMMLPGATVNSVALVDGVAAAAQRHGAIICTGVAVEAIRAIGGGKVSVETSHGNITARIVVAAVNAWLSELFPLLGKVIRPVQGQLIATQPMPAMFDCGMAAQVTAHGEYWQQMPDGTILLGGCRSVGAPVTDATAQVPQPEVHQALQGILPSLFPDLTEIGVQRGWAGAMAFTPDWIPIVDEIDESLWAVGGFSGHGMPFGASIGKLLAAHLTGGSPLANLTHLRLDRPTLPDPEAEQLR
ncbi:FAD-dependent oxidoreductase [Rhizocola hellebori]|uniref:FAD-dependent oxidoreductase n=1 Tax=Rhizocola hellebori TaxID=1392758 RepID=A0A8J3VGR3_9ACTN|nr:FAD-binding oxidoreductase [Rhizocola hellebori]GIH05427.1 FAD-dependent oxidoreductase [Rhizocola hellebori]